MSSVMPVIIIYIFIEFIDSLSIINYMIVISFPYVIDMAVKMTSPLYLKQFSVQFTSPLRSISTTLPIIGPFVTTSFLSNPGSHWCMFQTRRLYRRSEEVKKYFTETGDYNPPNQDVIDRFKRLRWGAYIHARAGRDKHLYRRSAAEVSRRSEHILTSRATSFLLDNMLNKQWQKPKYYPNDIYEPYHKRTGVPWDYGLRKPKFFP
ncbi:unnamed protein product [Heterobilharzia americana]|nr:unnamed protein product [Heterobilharzia americana]